MNLKLGKKAATPDDRDLLFSAYRTTALKAAPVGFDHTSLVTVPWGMLGNDTLGDCAIAGPMHETMLLNAAAGSQVPFTDTQAISAYSAITGYNPDDPATDQGSNVRDVLKYRAANGLIDAAGKAHRIGAYVALTAGDWNELLQALYVFECVGIGIRFPQSATTQFQDGKPWTVVRDSPIEGGHYIPVVAYPEKGTVDVVTWGAKQAMTEAFYQHYCDEAWAYVSQEDLAAGETLEGFNLTQLSADLVRPVITADPGSVEFLFAPQDDVQTAYLEVASAEQIELCVGAYAFTVAQLVTDLKANHDRGLSQFVLADLSQARSPSDHAALVEIINYGIDTVIGTAPSGNILHSKYLLGKSQQRVFSGSYNFSASAAVQDNCSQVFTGAAVWTAFRVHFDAARSWVIANEPQDQIKAAVVAGVPLESLRLSVPVRFDAEQ